MKAIPTIRERPGGKIPTTTVTNEHARAINAMAPMILGGQVLPPRVSAQAEPQEDECGEGEQFEVKQRLTANTCGYEFLMSHP